MPYAFQTSDYNMFLTLLNIMSIPILIGLTILANVLHYTVSAGFCWLIVILLFKHKYLTIINKNLTTHQKRNHKLVTLLTLSIGFVVFCATTLDLQKHTFTKVFAIQAGADLSISSKSINLPLSRNNISKILSNNDFVTQIVKSYTFVTFPLG